MLSIDQTIVINAPVGSIFDALTNPAKIPAYFPVTSVVSDGCIGGTFQLNGNNFTDHGTITEFTANHVFAYRYWSTNHGTENSPENHMIIRYMLRESGSSTTVSVRHENLLSQERFELMSGVWGLLLSALKRYVEGNDTG